jgi:hypothetical protein
MSPEVSPSAPSAQQSELGATAQRRRTVRRRLVLAVLGGAGLAAGGLLLPRSWLDPIRQPLSRRGHVVPDAEPGDIDAATRTALLAGIGALLGIDDLGRYEMMLVWRAKNLRGHRALYQGFVRRLDAAARASGGEAFVSLPAAAQRQLVSEAGRFGGRTSRVAQLWRVLSAPERIAYAEHIIAPVLTLFARTHAIVLAGYGPWPGQPRGLDAYRVPVRPSDGH